MQYDVIVVGAGPAGAAAAYDTASAGLATLLVDKKAFPRLKPCAGGLTIKALQKLRFSIQPVIQHLATDLQVSQGLRRSRLLTCDQPLVALTVREELDTFCRDKALAQGAQWRIISGLQGITAHDDRVVLTTQDGDELTARYVIGADGAHSQVRRLTGDFQPDRTAVALEALVPMTACRANHPLTFDFGVVGKGYGWLFPKRDHINVGLYTRRPEQFKLARQALLDYARKRLGSDTLQQVCGYPIATGGEFYSPGMPRVLLAGDAAGMAEPLLGEGIHNAIHSGQLAAQSIVRAIREARPALALYRSALRPLQQDLYRTRQVARAFYPGLALSYAALVRYPVRDVLVNGFAAGLTLHQCLQAFPGFQTRFHRRSSPTLAAIDG